MIIFIDAIDIDADNNIFNADFRPTGGMTLSASSEEEQQMMDICMRRSSNQVTYTPPKAIIYFVVHMSQLEVLA